MLITLKNILKIAEAENIAIGAFNVTSLEASGLSLKPRKS